MNGNFREKVYFSYEDQVLFVFDVLLEDEVILLLNTKKKVKLKPKNLFIKDDSLYMHMGDATVKFAEQGLIKIAKLLEGGNNQFYIRSDQYPLRTVYKQRLHLFFYGKIGCLYCFYTHKYVDYFSSVF